MDSVQVRFAFAVTGAGVRKQRSHAQFLDYSLIDNTFNAFGGFQIDNGFDDAAGIGREVVNMPCYSLRDSHVACQSAFK
jgi:hypothetical protein